MLFNLSTRTGCGNVRGCCTQGMTFVETESGIWMRGVVVGVEDGGMLGRWQVGDWVFTHAVDCDWRIVARYSCNIPIHVLLGISKYRLQRESAVLLKVFFVAIHSYQG